MTGKIFIKDLLVRSRIGINEEEKREPQDLLINLELTADVSPAIASDNINEAIDYRPIYHGILKLAEASRFDLVEKMGSEVAHLALRLDTRVQSVLVRIEKPHRFPFIKSVGVEFTISRS